MRVSVEPGEDSMKAWTKAIPVKSDRMQSQGLVMVVAPVLAALCLRALLVLGPGPLAYVAIGISLTFAGLVWTLRAATLAAAAMGGMVCLLVIAGAGSVGHSGLYALMTLFVVTFGATRAGRRVKQRAGLAEPRRGRSASQIIANLGVAGIVAGFFPVLLVAALVEATADTVSSEIGQAFGGQPMMLGSFRRVAVGTDGAVTVLGTQAGVLAAAVVALVGWLDDGAGWAAGRASR